MSSILRGFLVTGIALASFQASAQQNLLANGGFENPGFPFASQNFRYLNPGINPELADWFVTDNGIGQLSFIYHESRYPVVDGSYGLTLSEGSSISTGFSVQKAGMFNMSLHMTWSNGCALCFQPKPLEILVDGVQVATFSGLGSNWKYSDLTPTYFTSFSLGAGAHTLTLSNPELLGNFHEYRMDRIEVTAAPVPEPETAAMMALGLGVLGMMGRRRSATA